MVLIAFASDFQSDMLWADITHHSSLRTDVSDSESRGFELMATQEDEEDNYILWRRASGRAILLAHPLWMAPFQRHFIAVHIDEVDNCHSYRVVSDKLGGGDGVNRFLKSEAENGQFNPWLEF